jgi:hypothetical protein
VKEWKKKMNGRFASIDARFLVLEKYLRNGREGT